MVRFNLDLAYLNLIFLFIHPFIINHFLSFSLTGLSRILGGRAGARWVSSFVCFQSLTIQIINTLISFSFKVFLFCEGRVYIHEITISWEKILHITFLWLEEDIHNPHSIIINWRKKYHWSTYANIQDGYIHMKMGENNCGLAKRPVYPVLDIYM